VADFAFNIAKGRTVYYATLPAANDALILVLLVSAGIEADATLKDYDDLAALLAGTSDEATFTNYARKTVTASVTVTIDDTNDRVDVDMPDPVWTNAGGATNNTLAKLLVCYDNDTTAGTDSAIVPLSSHDFSVTTDGSNLTGTVDPVGFYRAS
jgi:hypothetical protein